MSGAQTIPPLLVVDAANVVGSVPDGWWRDRRGATERLRDALADVGGDGLPGGPGGLPGPVDVVLVVEGAARGVRGLPTVRVIEAAGSADDAIVELVRAVPGDRSIVVVTADRGLRSRVAEFGAIALGPQVLPYGSGPYRTGRSRARRS